MSVDPNQTPLSLKEPFLSVEQFDHVDRVFRHALGNIPYNEEYDSDAAPDDVTSVLERHLVENAKGIGKMMLSQGIATREGETYMSYTLQVVVDIPETAIKHQQVFMIAPESRQLFSVAKGAFHIHPLVEVEGITPEEAINSVASSGHSSPLDVTDRNLFDHCINYLDERYSDSQPLTLK